ncbi:SigB/SigF/SigG family RNA polymerase sigma factor [Pseudonocardia sp.]|uniref:SigB/SigF/SigG family RNA polymerase sigma factor n=1 Tax=Pseudonocardia sp. TaxID=60912 RepID=UPI0031FBD19E
MTETLLCPRPAAPPGSRPRPVGTSGSGGGRTHEYAHLSPLFVELAGLPEGHPRRAELRGQLITGYLPVAQHIALRYTHRGELLSDLEQVATVGLIQAVDRFDPGRGFEFLTFAVPTITGEVQRWFRDRAWTIRMPRRLQELLSAISRATDALSQELGRAPRQTEIAARLDVDVSDVVEGLLARNAYRCKSLDQPAGMEFRDSTVRAGGAVDPSVALIEDRETLTPLIDALPERERKIVLLRFFGDMTQNQIAREVGISQMHVSRLLSRTLAGLRRAMIIDS